MFNDRLCGLVDLNFQVKEFRMKVLELGGIVHSRIFGGFFAWGLMPQMSLLKLAESGIVLVQFGVSIIKDIIYVNFKWLQLSAEWILERCDLLLNWG